MNRFQFSLVKVLTNNDNPWLKPGMLMEYQRRLTDKIYIYDYITLAISLINEVKCIRTVPFRSTMSKLFYKLWEEFGFHSITSSLLSVPIKQSTNNWVYLWLVVIWRPSLLNWKSKYPILLTFNLGDYYFWVEDLIWRF